MKRFFKVFLIVLLLCPVLLLTACGTSVYYSISVSPSDFTLGSVVGTLNNESQLEGTTMALSVKENKPTTNPFICWIKDNSRIVSTTNNLNLTYNSQSQGRYTALFDETAPNKMMYASLNNIDFQYPENVANVNFSLNYARTISGSGNFILLESGTATNNKYNSTKTSVIYLGSAGTVNNYRYRIRLNMTIVDVSGQESTYTIDCTDILNNSSFNNNAYVSFTISDNIAEGNIVLTFSKLSKSFLSEE